MFCLVDGDPYGINIYGIYKYGGDRSSVVERERLSLPNLQFIGIKNSDFEGDEGIIRLTVRDQRKIETMLEKDWVKQEPDVMYIMNEIY